MPADNEEVHYKVWASDNVVYGPVLLETLLEWVADGRVLADTWVFSQEVNSWKPAKSLPPLGDALANYHATQAPLPTPTELGQASDSITVDYLRQFDALAGLGLAELEQFISHCIMMEIEEGGLIMKKDSPGDGLYMILSGETRVRLVIAGQDTTLANVGAGSFIGEVAMFSQAPRTADVLALTPCNLLFMSAEAFRNMMQSEPKLASAVLFALGHIMADRMMAGNQRLQSKVSSEFLWLQPNAGYKINRLWGKETVDTGLLDGQVFSATALGESIPEGWLVDELGLPTTDPSAFPAKATLTPMAAHKGYGLALLIEILSGVLTGAALAGGILSYAYDDPSKPTNHGAAFVAIQIEAMMERAEFEKRMQSLIDEIKNAPKAAGIQHILIPGEREQKYKAKALEEGVNLPDDVWAKLVEVSESSGVALPAG